MKSYDVIVIGAGLAGIAVALRLKKAGFSVLVLEKAETHGGKLGEYKWENYRWDKGPSLFTLPEQVDELFELYDKNPREHFSYVKIDDVCHYYFSDGSDFLFHSNPEERKKAIREHFSENDGKALIDYLEESGKTYEKIGDIFIDKPKFGLKNIFDKELLTRYPQLLSRKVIRSLDQHNERRFDNANLKQLFNRYGTYNGSDPYKMSGLYSMIAHLELNCGTFFPTKGMRHIVDALYDLAVEVGVEFSFDAHDIEATALSKGYAVTYEGNNIMAERLVSAIDCVTFYKSVLSDQNLANKYAVKERSSSALIFYWAVEKVIPELKLHNLFFSEDYKAEFAQIFDQKIMPEEPTIYLHVSSVVNAEDAPENGQNWFLMVNTPAGLVPSEEQKNQVRSFILRTIQAKFGVDIQPHLKYEVNWDSEGIERDTGSYMGALYGASSNAKMAALTRHGNDSKKYKGLYFCGGTVHPGGGIPLVLKSSKIVAELIIKRK